MTTKEHLQSIYIMSQKIKRLNEIREAIRNDLYSLGGISYDRDKVQVSPSGDRMLKLVARLDEIERDYVKEIDELTERRQKILNEIDEIPNEKYKLLLIDRYVLCKKWERIAVERDKDIRWIYRMHGGALDAFERVHNH